MNEQALARLHVEKQIAFIPGATHLFEEAGALEEVAHLARAWFTRYLHRAAGCPRPSHLVVPGAPDDV